MAKQNYSIPVNLPVGSYDVPPAQPIAPPRQGSVGGSGGPIFDYGNPVDRLRGLDALRTVANRGKGWALGGLVEARREGGGSAMRTIAQTAIGAAAGVVVGEGIAHQQQQLPEHEQRARDLGITEGQRMDQTERLINANMKGGLAHPNARGFWTNRGLPEEEFDKRLDVTSHAQRVMHHHGDDELSMMQQHDMESPTFASTPAGLAAPAPGTRVTSAGGWKPPAWNNGSPSQGGTPSRVQGNSPVRTDTHRGA